MRNFLNSIELFNLIKSVNAWGKTTVKTENLTFDNSCQWKIIEKLSELFPYIGISVLSQTFIIKSIAKKKLDNDYVYITLE